MTDEATTHDKTNATPQAATPPPGWSNAPPDDGISSTEPPPPVIDMTVPGWSNSGEAPPEGGNGDSGSAKPPRAVHEAPDRTHHRKA